MNFKDDPDIDFYQNYLRKELFEKVKEDSLIFEFIQEGVLDGLWYWDLLEPENEWMSPKFWKTFGYDPQTKKHLASEWQKMIFEEDLKLAISNFQKHISDPSYPYDQIVRYKHKDGSTKWVRCRGLALHNTAGTPVRMIGAHTDVTALMKKQQELVREQFNVDKLKCQLLSTENSLKLEKMNNANLQHQLAELTYLDEETGLGVPQYLHQEGQKLYEIATRVQTPFNFMMFKLNNHHSIINNFGNNEVRIKLTKFDEIMKQQAPQFLRAQLDADTILAIQIGYAEEQITTFSQRIINEINQQKWSIVSPIWSFANVSKTPDSNKVDYKLLEQTYRAFFESIYSQLSQKLLYS